MEENTHFAPPQRSTSGEILYANELISSQKLINEIFGSLTGISAIIDNNRQIIYANDDFLTMLGLKSLEPILGKRVGEIVSCIHSEEEPFGCGTSEACRYCGAVNAIIESQRTGEKIVKEARITTMVDGKFVNLDMNVTSTPIVLSDRIFYVMALVDIGNEKRRVALERIFFHDLLNIAGGLNGLLTLLKEVTNPEEAKELIDLSEKASRDILDEIMLHRQIRDAETGDLQVGIELVNSFELLLSAKGKINSHEVGKNKSIIIADQSVNAYFETDKVLFQKVIINLLKNALEATEDGKSVTTGAEETEDKIRFWVKNESVMTKEVQMQLFHRSFSTKGSGRGIGTYSIRLLTENYLKGSVSFVSNETERTVFSIELNKKYPADLPSGL